MTDEELRSKGAAILTACEAVRIKQAEARALVEELAFQGWLMAQGIDPQLIVRWERHETGRGVRNGAESYNRVVMADGRKISLGADVRRAQLDSMNKGK